MSIKSKFKERVNDLIDNHKTGGCMRLATRNIVFTKEEVEAHRIIKTETVTAAQNYLTEEKVSELVNDTMAECGESAVQINERRTYIVGKGLIEVLSVIVFADEFSKNSFFMANKRIFGEVNEWNLSMLN